MPAHMPTASRSLFPPRLWFQPFRPGAGRGGDQIWHWRARREPSARLQPTRFRSRAAMSGSKQPGLSHEGPGAGCSRLWPSRDRPRGRGSLKRSWCGIGEGCRPPPRPLAFDRQALPGERAVQGGGGVDRTARVDPGTATARAGWHEARGRAAVCLTAVVGLPFLSRSAWHSTVGLNKGERRAPSRAIGQLLLDLLPQRPQGVRADERLDPRGQ